MNAEAELRNQNERLELLLNLTASITSSLDLREVLRAIAANIREVMHADAVTVVLPDAGSEKFRKDDVYDAFFHAVGAPDWHGRNCDALKDSIANGSINEVEVPYRLVLKHYDLISGEAKKMTDDFV